MFRGAIAAAAVCLLTGGSAALAETSAGMRNLVTAVLGQEHSGLTGLGAGRVARLASAPGRAVTDVSYSEDWIAAQPVATGGEQWQCLTEALYFEARGEEADGLFAVAEVILNRVDSPRFPDTACGVINQGTGRYLQCQFTYTCDSADETMTDRAAYRRVGKVARAMLDGAPRLLTSGATHYHTVNVNPDWSRRFLQTAEIGVHRFYRMTTRISRN